MNESIHIKENKKIKIACHDESFLSISTSQRLLYKLCFVICFCRLCQFIHPSTICYSYIGIN